ncbi:MAG: FAD-binding oxidoreductase [Candidatus Hodarchaeota archaeon]
MTVKVNEDYLISVVGEENVLSDPADLVVYSSDATPLKGRPSIVVFPHKTEEVVQIVKHANENKIPVVPRGAGSCLSGGPVAIMGGILLDFTKMNKILEIDEENFQAMVEPGVVHKDLDKELSKRGLFFPPDPSSQDWVTIGGMIAENAGGMRAVKYGVTGDWTKGLEVVLPTGEVMWTGSKCVKVVSGYDLTKLFVGSEGTLGIFTRALLGITTLPESRLAALAYFENLEQAGRCIYRIIREGLDPSAAELMDRLTMDAVSRFTGMEFPESEAVIIVELDGDSDNIKKRSVTLEKIFREEKAICYETAKDEGEVEKMFENRHAAYAALASYKPTVEVEDVTVPLSKIVEMLNLVVEIAEKHDIMIATFGHMGDGNLHPSLLFDDRIPREKEIAERAKEDLFKAALQLQGTITGEHGVGVLKRPYFPAEHDSVEISAMKAIKRVLDPNSILNPGKIFED